MKIRSIFLFSLASLFCCSGATAQSWRSIKSQVKNEVKKEGKKMIENALTTQTLRIEAFPQSLEAFDGMYNQMATTPEGAVMMFIVAMDTYIRNEELGKQCFGLCFHPQKRNGDLPDNHFLSFMHDRFYRNSQEWLARSYFEGSSPENGYQISAPYTMKVRRKATDRDYLTSMDADVEKCWVHSSGADSDRPAQVLRVKGETLYYIFSYGGIPSQIRPPKRQY